MELGPKVVAPDLPASTIERPDLEHRLDLARSRRLTVVAAAPGFGKSTALAAWAGRNRAAWYTADSRDREPSRLAAGLVTALRVRYPSMQSLDDVVRGGPEGGRRGRAYALAGAIAEAAGALDRDTVVLVIDDVDEIPARSAGAMLLDGLVRQALPSLHLIVAGRSLPPLTIDRLRAKGEVLEIAAPALAYNPEETARALAAVLDGEVQGSEVVHEITGGWPAAVRLAAELLSSGDADDAINALRQPGGALFGYLTTEVIERTPPDVLAVVQLAALFPRITPELCEHLGGVGARRILPELEQRGLFLEPSSGVAGWYRVPDLIRQALDQIRPVTARRRRTLARRATAWLSSHGHVGDALALAAAGDAPEAVMELLADHGRALVGAGLVDEVLDAARSLDRELLSPAVATTLGQALLARSRWDEALDVLAGADDGGPLTAEVAWRIGLIHHLRGDIQAALAVYERAVLDQTTPIEEALTLAWRSGAHWLRGDVGACRTDAEAAMAVARRSGDRSALAAAFTAAALVAAMDGDRRSNVAHYVRALTEAEEARDVLTIIRVRTNRGSRAMREGAFAEAREELALAIRLAEATGYASLLALALSNRATVHLLAGELDAAIADFDTALATWQSVDSKMAAYAENGLGDAHLVRGQLAQARGHYERALVLGRATGDMQALAPALAGLARVVAADDPDRARSLIDEALNLPPSLSVMDIQLAAGWVALLHGDRQRAAAHGSDAAALATARPHDRPALAEALELQALTAGDGSRRLRLLDEARALWDELGAGVDAARNEVVRHGRASRRRRGGRRPRRHCRALGVREGAAAAAGPLAVVATERPGVSIDVLGAFRVLRQGAVVPTSEWQSRKARDVLKILLAHRGRSVTRDALIEALWPGDAGSATGPRLSVALSTVRTVLDPERRFPSDHFIPSDRTAVRVDLAHISVDLEAFVGLAIEALDRARHEGAPAIAALEEAEAAYTGDPFEEDAYEGWAEAVREEARALYLQTARMLARLHAASSRPDAVVRYALRVCELDPYDERGHLALVAALAAGGQHGEARRRYRLYTGLMAEIGVEAEPFHLPPVGHFAASARERPIRPVPTTVGGETEEAWVLLLAIIVFGMLIGWLAQLVLGMGTRPNLQSLVAGLVGSFVGGLLVSLLAGDGLRLRPSGLLGSFAGAVVVLLIWGAIDRRRAPVSRRATR